MSLGFIGLGNIGRPMARQLLKLGEEVLVYDLAPEGVQELVAAGARAAPDPGEIARRCRVIGLCVRDAQQLEALLHGARLLELARPGAVLLVHSTVAQAPLLRWAGEAQARGVHLLDAPMTGGAAAASAGTLTYMVGGDAALVEACRPILETSGTVLHAGPIGAGMLLKLCNNLMSYAALAALDEACTLAAAGTLDPALLIEVGRRNGVVTGQMAAFATNRSQLAHQGETAVARAMGPFAALARKDLQAALQSAAQLGLTLPLTACTAERIEAVFLKGNGMDASHFKVEVNR
ncbi:MAG: NAD(P)-dependent oxidoreductase [Proteobacteria bacterium]|nr:NAD(P)-dependent oxidoreductase [Pseudomonadota bacterium]